jgi:hypothetical protein
MQLSKQTVGSRFAKVRLVPGPGNRAPAWQQAAHETTPSLQASRTGVVVRAAARPMWLPGTTPPAHLKGE